MPSAPIPLSLPLPRGPCQETAPPCPPPCPPLVPHSPHQQLRLQGGASGLPVGLNPPHDLCPAPALSGPRSASSMPAVSQQAVAKSPLDLTELTASPSRQGKHGRVSYSHG